MSKQRNIEAIFSENLDRILAGEEIDFNALGDAEMRSALEFARKVNQLVPAPSTQFSTRLKAGLLQKLDEREARAKENRGWSWNFLRRPAWQAVIAVIVVVLVVSVVWRSGVFRPTIEAPSKTMTTTTTASPTTTPAPTATTAPTTMLPSVTTAPGALLSVGAWTSKSAYIPGEGIGISILMGNSSKQQLALEKLPPILSIMREDTGKPVYTFAAGKETTTLAPGASVQFNYTWDGLDFNGARVSGRYYIELEDLEYQGNAVPLHLSQTPYFEVLPAPGTQTSEIRSSETQTDNNISVTMQRVDISDTGIIIEAFITPPLDYMVTQGSGGYFTDKDYSASAEYSFDGGWVEQVGGSAVVYLQNGMNHTWFIPGIILPEAKELFFHVTAIGGWQGSWQFHIPLE